MGKLYNNARVLTKLMLIHDMVIIDKLVDIHFEDYFDDYVESAFIDDGNTTLLLSNGDLITIEELAKSMQEAHLEFVTGS